MFSMLVHRCLLVVVFLLVTHCMYGDGVQDFVKIIQGKIPTASKINNQLSKAFFHRTSNLGHAGQCGECVSDFADCALRSGNVFFGLKVKKSNEVRAGST
jgi:hypothetical protein